jgi:SAM-dependent methyltransferase
MNPEEYDKMGRLEGGHWFYRGKRRIVRHWLEKTGGLRPETILADCGAGTGAFAVEMSSVCKVIAVDDHRESLEVLRSKLSADQVVAGSCTALGLSLESCDRATALDVLEHIPDDRAAAAELWRILKPGGILVVTVPAMMALWSDWDVVLHHCRRYDRRGLESLLKEAGFELLWVNYVNVIVCPLIWLVRKWRGWFPQKSEERAEDRLPPSWLNTLLEWGFVAPACQGVVHWPLGVGLLAVCRKPVKV